MEEEEMANAVKMHVKDEFRKAAAEMVQEWFSLYHDFADMVEAEGELTGEELATMRLSMKDNIDRRDSILMELFAMAKGAKMYAPKNADIHKLNPVMMWRKCRELRLSCNGAEAIDIALADAAVWTAAEA